jgi:hypothetical protein
VSSNHIGPFFLLIVANLALTVTAAQGSELRMTPADQELLRSAMAGKTADYTGLPNNERTISAEFLKRLLFDTPEAKVPGKSIHIKGAIVSFFNVAADPDSKLVTSSPFEVVFESSLFSSFVCQNCRFKQGLRFVRNTFGFGGGTGELALDGLQTDGNFELLNENTLLVSLSNAQIAGVAKIWTPASSTIHADHLKVQAINISAASPVSVLANNIQAESIDVEIRDGVRLSSSSIQIYDSVAQSVHIDTCCSIDLLRASGLKSKSASFVGTRHSEPDVWEPEEVSSLVLARANIENELVINNLQIQDLDAQVLSSKQSAFFNVDAKRADLSWSNFDTLEWMTRSSVGKTRLDGATFRILDVIALPSFQPSTDSALKFLRQADFSSSAFSAYQTQLRTRGENAEAEKVYIAMREQMRDQDWKQWYTWPLGVVDLFQQYVLGYGRSPIPSLIWSMVFFAVGSFIFQDVGKMEPRVEKPGDFSGAWYSLELFLPIVDLGVAKEWRPKPIPQWRVAYARVHQMAGWILIPVSVAAFTGITK